MNKFLFILAKYLENGIGKHIFYFIRNCQLFSKAAI